MEKQEFIIYFISSTVVTVGISSLFSYFFTKAGKALKQNDNQKAGKYLEYIGFFIIILLLAFYTLFAIISASAFPFGAPFID